MSEANKIATEKDWDRYGPSSYYRGDIEYAREQFSGKSIEEMIPRFVDFPLSAREDLSYMPKIRFNIMLWDSKGF